MTAPDDFPPSGITKRVGFGRSPFGDREARRFGCVPVGVRDS